MRIGLLALSGVVLLSGFALTAPVVPAIEFLTRDGCVATDRMRANLDLALKKLNRSVKYTVTDVDTLDATDSKRGYGTPTVLVNGQDLFGMPAPEAQEHAPT